MNDFRYEGQVDQNPWVFSHFDLQSARLKQNGQLIRPELEFENTNSVVDKGVIQAYRNMMSALGMNLQSGQTNGLTIEDFIDHSFCLSYDLSYDLCAG